MEKLDINDPVIENLTFRLDNLDIKDLSGALNLGTNFGITVNQDEKKKKTPSESKESGKFQTKKTSNAKETDTVVNQNSKGYSFKFNNGRE
ncbi:hypothetical protein J2S74_000956 [Evansella vedderi]|uniref:Uncharacterized protein n=1 Tax=Evansella vedderi TaxID=38282 RepID=A0ABT9ZRT9_9BACI|nr:hypothetical protein [Evansella vedderi]